MNKKGAALLIVIALIMMLMILAAAAMMLSTSHFGTSFHQVKRTRAYYAAEAAMWHAFYRLRTEMDKPPVNMNFPEDINGISKDKISIKVKAKDFTGCHPVKIEVQY